MAFPAKASVNSADGKTGQKRPLIKTVDTVDPLPNEPARPYLYPMPRIRFLDRKDIDTDRWDQCVRDSPHSDIYALSGYLDIMARHWSGLVQDDYSAVLPIPWNRKYFLSYVYTPRFTSPLPLCGDPSTMLPLADFLSQIPRRFILWDLDISKPQASEKIPYPHHHRTNYLLPLGRDYDNLFSAFRPGYRNLIRQAHRDGFRAERNGAYAQLICNTSQKKDIEGVKHEDYDRFQRLCDWLAPRDMLETWETVGPDGQCCAGAVFAKTARKIYYLLAWNNDQGRSASASHLLMNEVIRSHANSRYTLDFEGSDHPGIAHFMQGFGAEKQDYLHITKRLFYGV
jgi:hypothetical protein